MNFEKPKNDFKKYRFLYGFSKFTQLELQDWPWDYKIHIFWIISDPEYPWHPWEWFSSGDIDLDNFLSKVKQCDKQKMYTFLLVHIKDL